MYELFVTALVLLHLTADTHQQRAEQVLQNQKLLTETMALGYAEQQKLIISNDQKLADKMVSTIHAYNSFLLDLEKRVEQNGAALGTNVAICTKARVNTGINTNVLYNRNPVMYSVRIGGREMVGSEVISYTTGAFTVPQGAGGIYRLQFSLSDKCAVRYSLHTVRNETKSEEVKEPFDVKRNTSKVIYRFLKDGDSISVEKVSSRGKGALYFCIHLLHPHLGLDFSNMDLPTATSPLTNRTYYVPSWPHWESTRLPASMAVQDLTNARPSSALHDRPRGRLTQITHTRITTSQSNNPTATSCNPATHMAQIAHIEEEVTELRRVVERKFDEAIRILDERDSAMEQKIKRVSDLKRLKGERGESGRLGSKGERGDAGQPGVRGYQGIPGQQGDKGNPGSEGKNGLNGQRGSPGRKGERGMPGPPGSDETLGSRPPRSDNTGRLTTLT